MAELSYIVEQSPLGTSITFNVAPPVRTRTALENLGFRFNYRFGCWVGKKNIEEAIEVAEQAKNRRKAFRKKVKEKAEGTLCWKCKKAYGKCSWSKKFKPVKGWEAKRCIINNGTCSDGKSRLEVVSYMVKSCPEFELEIRQRPSFSVEDEDEG